MNFLTQQQELAAQLGLDVTDADTLVLLKRWLNTSQQMICQAADWPFLRSPTPLILQTVADYDTGTISTTANSATITFSTAPSVSLANRYIKTASSNDWYRITAHTASDTSATISPAAIYTTSGATFTVRKFYYSVDNTVDRILQIRQAANPGQLEIRDKEGFDRMNADPSHVGTPSVFVMAGKDSTDNWQFILWPTPNEVINLWIEYIRAATDLSADSDVSPIPAKWHTSVMLEGAKWQGYTFNDDSRADGARVAFYNGIERMKSDLLPAPPQSRGLGSIDNALAVFPFPLPPEYGREGQY